MSRSRRKTPYTGYTSAVSEKQDKRIWHQRMRSHCRDVLRKALHDFDPDVFLPHENEVGNIWAMAKDGKGYFNPDEHPDIMRK